jgi:hypothetical protein
MDTQPRMPYPNIVPCLVLPFEKTCTQGSYRYPALVFAQHGSTILFAAEYARRFGVGTLDAGGEVEASDQYATLDAAARIFLSRTCARI